MKALPTQMVRFFMLVLLIAGFNPAWAQYPNRPINMIVPYAPAGGADLGSRIMAEYMAEFLGQRMVSIYKPGGGGSLGATLVARAPADGYTVLVGSPTPLVLSPIVLKMDYKLDDFILVGNYGCIPMWLMVRGDAKWKTLEDFINDARKSDAKLNVGSYGANTVGEFLIHVLSRDAGVTLIHVPFKSSGEAQMNVLSKVVDAVVVVGSGGGIKSGAVRILAVAEKARLSGLADVPTFTELGYPIVMTSCYSFALPKGTPKEIVDRLAQAQKKAFERYGEEIKQKLRVLDLWASPSTPEEAMAEYRRQYQTLHKIAEELGAVAK